MVRSAVLENESIHSDQSELRIQRLCGIIGFPSVFNLVTEKGYESESYSESEDESKAQPSEDSSSVKQPLSRLDEEKKVKEKSQKKAPSATNKTTKQASITGFFQKK